MDHRTTISKMPRIIQDLREYGYGDEDPIPFQDLKYCIAQVCGSDPRTLRHYLEEMVEFGYLIPVKGLPVTKRRDVTVSNPRTGSMRIQIYSSRLGFQFYRFGPRAPKRYQEDLSPSLSPFEKLSMNVHQKNMCVSINGLGVGGNGSGGILEASGKRVGRIEKEEKKERLLTRTHIHNTVIEEETISTHLSEAPVKLRKQPSEADLLSLYENLAKAHGEDLLVRETLKLEQCDRRERKDH